MLRLRDFASLTNHSLGGADGRFFHQLLGGNEPDEQFTIVILSHRREPLLTTLLDTYLHLPHLHSVLVVWNWVEGSPSAAFCHRFRLYTASGRLRLLRSASNSLANRFLPFAALATDAVLSLDDDVLLQPAEVAFAFRVWRQHRHLLVGFPARNHAWHLRQRRFTYQPRLACEYSMVLTGAAFFHRFYSHHFSLATDPRVLAKIEELGNCEVEPTS